MEAAREDFADAPEGRDAVLKLDALIDDVDELLTLLSARDATPSDRERTQP
ncbi:MAG: hypothetical protein ABSG43_13995 [Solirubrobacteraceae bacterium]|jgi:hypothetical protein